MVGNLLFKSCLESEKKPSAGLRTQSYQGLNDGEYFVFCGEKGKKRT